MSTPRTEAGTFLRNGLEAMGYDEQSANEAIIAIENEAATPPSEEAMSITSHVTVGQCSCGEHHGAAPSSEEATGLDPAPGTSLWRFLNYPETMQIDDWVRLADAYVARLTASDGGRE